jgi:hypothetical protein
VGWGGVQPHILVKYEGGFRMTHVPSDSGKASERMVIVSLVTAIAG